MGLSRSSRSAALFAVAAASLIALAPASSALATAPTPVIKAVHFSNIGPNMRIEVDGNGFGAPADGLPYVGTVSNFEFADTSRGELWGRYVDNSLQFTSWTNTRIVVNGVGGYQKGQLMPGDQVSVSISNKSGGPTATWSGTLNSSPGPAPVVGEPNPVITGLYFSDIGPNLRIVLMGAGFGTPVIGLPDNGTVKNFEFSDTSRGELWGRYVDNSLNYVSWTDQRIVADDPGGYQPGQLVTGDQVSVWVQNATSGEYYTWTGTLHASTALPGGSTGPAAPTSKRPLTLGSVTVAVGGKQTATVAINAGEWGVVVVDYPNGTQKVLGPTVAPSNDQVRFTWAVPSGIQGVVRVTLDAGGTLTRASFTVT